MLEDKFGRRFHYLRLSITDVCNFRCSYCLPDGYQCDGDRDFLSKAEIRPLVQAFAGLGTSKIRLTGGEPSLRKDLPEIIALCAQTPGVDKVALTTNGFKLPQMIQSWADAGLNALNVSIDSLDPRQFKAITGHNKLDTILKGVDEALALGIKVKINSVLLRPYSESTLSLAMEWLKDKPVSLRLIELMQTGDNQAFFKANHLSGQPIKDSLLRQGWLQVLREKTAGPAQEFAHPDYAGRIGLIMPYSKDFCKSCNRLRVSAKGKLHLCLFADQGLDLRDLLRDGDVKAIQARLVELLGRKEASHWLDKGYTGATSQLAMLGG
ncbi:GTP 3',8-cyclase MoaA [Aliiglaciecola sp. CAU 1673]|uniref:GTP 3',8-cyclase MoaA n=1 Tax=Aliiglaciecola sp. CAU 1673 TaxID=3032595 RepID=UPI0023D9AD40|nr:GTP 3',8-cyclase MoaA [Aliiglaciecola sp. CAU 1673]MDF2177399.1 GTP 3',8-cyclase MoaA [Aliiglaciecola sp. CAU 1673]